jgi:hypothetical protein
MVLSKWRKGYLTSSLVDTNSIQDSLFVGNFATENEAIEYALTWLQENKP